MRLDVILNPHARAFARRGIEAVRRAVGAIDGARLHVTPSLEALDEVAQTIAADHDGGAVALAGGDGTLMAGVTALERVFGADLPPIVPLAGGTAGTVGRNWGIADAPEARLRRLAGGPRRVIRRPTLCIDASTDAGGEVQERRIGFIFGTGLVAQFFRIYEARGAPGYSGAARIVARIFAESFVGGPLATQVLTPMPCQLEVDGVPRPQDAWSLVCASVVPNLGIHMMLTYRGGEDPKRPHLVATPLPPRALGPRAPLVLLGRSIGGDGSVDTLTPQLRVTFPERGAYVLDGELLEADRVEVTAGPVLDIVVPTR